MLVADSYLGHRTDDDVAARLDGTDPLSVVLSATDRRRSRVRTETDDGRDIGIVVARDLADGDVLETESGDLVVVELAEVDALVVDFGAADVAATTALALGHALGNRHWDLAVRGEAALFPVADTRERTEATVADLLPAGVTTRFESVPPTTFDDATPDQSRDGHRHADSHHDGAHGHGHDDAHTHHHHGVRPIDGETDE